MQVLLRRCGHLKFGKLHHETLPLRGATDWADRIRRGDRERREADERPTPPVRRHLNAENARRHRRPYAEVARLVRVSARCPVGPADRENTAQLCLTVGELDASLDPVRFVYANHDPRLVVQRLVATPHSHLSRKVSVRSVSEEVTTVVYETVMSLAPEIGQRIRLYFEHITISPPTLRLVQPDATIKHSSPLRFLSRPFCSR